MAGMTIALKAKKIRQHITAMISAPRNMALRAANIPLRPKWLVFMPTDKCNSRCLHCNIWQQKSTENPLSVEEIERIFADELFKKVSCVMLTGGEATMRRDIKEVILTLHKVLPEAMIQLSTNALLPERAFEAASAAVEQGVDFDIGVSLDGIGEAHDKMRGVQGNFAKADWLLRKLVDFRKSSNRKFQITAGIVLSDYTLDSLEEVRRYAKSLGISLAEQWYNESSFYGNQKSAQFQKRLYDTVRSQPPTLLQETWLKALEGKPYAFPCFALSSFCVVKCGGDVVPCLNMWDWTAGNLREKSPRQVWSGETANEVRSRIKSCKGCLNGWQAGWSYNCSFYQILSFYLRHPGQLAKKLF